MRKALTKNIACRMMYGMNVFEDLRRLIKASDKTMYTIARDTGVDRAALSRFMSGERGLSVESVEEIARLLGHELKIVAVKPSRKAKEKSA